MTSLREIEIMKDSLMSEKQVSSAYSLVIKESTCPQLTNVLSKCFNNVLQCQFEILTAMNQRGWYEIKEVDIDNLKDIQSKYTKVFNELS